ncbi:MAG: hypothetical protein FJZ87_06500 [Chloroflexi bacterium]|nr:hypothetical protein [Chloroflexota bacterium]
MRILFLFLDGVGLGEQDPAVNPFARAQMPYLQSILDGNMLTRHAAPFEGDYASLLAIDAGLGVDGLPQSASGQAALLTGINIPMALGYHYGPKPNPAIAKYLDGNTLFSQIHRGGRKTALLNAYPPRYFDGIDSGRRIYSAIPLALTNSGLSLFTKQNLYEGDALSADFTGSGWRELLGFPDAPILEPVQAGKKLSDLARMYDFAMFEYWASDYAGHKQDMDWAVRQLEVFDEVLQGMSHDWLFSDGLILVTSDHGNMEDLSTRRHTNADVPLLLMGKLEDRQRFLAGIQDLTGIAPAIIKLLGLN